MSIELRPDDADDSRLLRAVRPPDWVNPEPASRYHLVVIGAGTAGLVTAAGAAGLGARVALVERDLLGGDCLNAGCVPSKALLRSARALAEIRRAPSLGVSLSGEATADFETVMARIRRLRANLSPADSAERFRQLGVDVFLGEGRFSGPDTVEVSGRTLRFGKAVIATGSRARRPAIPGLTEAGFLTNESVFALTALPRRLAVLGGGPIGCELAQAFARLGAEVTLLHSHSQLLPRDDPDAAWLIEAALRRDGVTLRLGAVTVRVEARADGKALVLADGEEVVVDAILVAAGRQPNVERLGLEAAQVEHDPRQGVRVDDRLRTSNSRIYAAGDVCSRYRFTHAADAMARIVIQNALFLGRRRVSRLIIPWCTYTDPEVAHVGVTSSEGVRTFCVELAHVDRAVLDDASEGFVKVHVAEGSDRIVGATVVGAHAGELIASLSLAMTAKAGLKALASTVFPYPTLTEAIRKVGDAYNRTRLTPWSKRLLRWWLSWR